MTSRSKNAVRVYETEIEKSREESNWKKAVELALQLKARSPQHESLAHFLIGEGKLEAHLEEWPPIKDNIERAQRELSEARGYLTLATDDNGIKAGVALDAHLLLGKLEYACGAYDEALKHYRLAELNTLTEKELPVRSLRIVAESYAIKGLCLEENALPTSTSRYKQVEKETEMIRSFEVSSELSLLYLQRASGSGGGGGGGGGSGCRAGPTLETALQRAPLMLVQAGRLHAAVDRYREMLSAVESQATQSLRLTLARQLAELLMRGLPGQMYKPPSRVPVAPVAAAPGTLTRRREEYVSEGPWKPKKYAAINQFVPRNELEEMLLVLLVGEAMAVRSAVLSQSAEFEAARNHALRAAVALVDLLALPAVRWQLMPLLLESLERAMKFSFGVRHVWRQRALATAAAAAAAPRANPADHAKPGSASWSAGVRARSVAVRAAQLAPGDAPLRLVAATTCYQMGWIDEGIEFAEAALAVEEEKESFMLARCHLYVGIGHQMKGQKTNSRIDKEAANETALRHLLKSVELDDNDHLALYYLGLQHVYLGNLNQAMEACRACLNARSECARGLRLCIALWSCSCAGPRAERALRAAELARSQYPEAEWPLQALAALQVSWELGDAALATGRDLLALVTSQGANAADESPAYAELDVSSQSQHDTRDAASVRAESAGAYLVERALSEGGGSSRGEEGRAAHAAAWLVLAAQCLRLDKISAAAGCVAEAAAITPYSHLVLYTRGCVHAASKEWEEARACFQNALAIHPTHVDSMLQLGCAYYALGWLGLAERALREAAATAPARADVWRRLGSVLAARGEPAAAADAAAAALALHPNLPHLPLPI